MTPQQARARVVDTFPQAFNRTKFLEFTRNLLHRFDESKAAQWNATYVKDAFKPHIARFERLGTYTSPGDEKLDVLIIHLTNESKLERARTAIRNFVADHLKTRDNKDAALVAFVSPTERQWRFSYVKMEYAAVKTESGKVGVETRLTPARRFSYIVGEGESSHTAQFRFLALLQDTENLPTLAQIEDAFSVEAVTKEFFNQYAALFNDIETALQKLAAKDKTIGDEFKKKHVSTVDFAKKLMGQIVFLYFLQKKGWLGVEKGKDWGTGPHDFLRRLARGEYGAYENFFNDILEPLFYDILATDRGHEAWCKRFKCRIPFLNGGLFEPLGDYNWRKTDITLPNKFFTNSDPDDKTGDIGTGVLDVFDRYNFTVNEAEPLEKEVAIDPEMLGKVFENLIEENRRKGLGSFYTPREIVHYMCQESLINYLDTSVNMSKENVPRADLETFVHLGDQISHYEAVDTRYVGREMPKQVKEHAKVIDEKLADIAVCDPAVGSGAFPVGMMTEIVRARCALTPYFNDVHDRTPYHFKRHVIQSCLYGVDIDPGAVEIAKLRLWLSLVVDEEEVKQIKPLPNLDFKIVSGNSLIGFPFRSQRLEQIEKLKGRFFEETNHEAKAKLKQEIELAISECFAASKRSLGYEVNFDFEIYFSEVFHHKGRFDVVIANPPWGAELSATDKGNLKARFPEIDSSTPNSFAYFVGVALRIARANLAYVLPDSILIKDFAKTRKLLKPTMRELHWYQNIGVPEVYRPFLNVEHDVCVIISHETPTKELLCSTRFYQSEIRDFVARRWVACKDEMILEEFDYAFNLMLRKEDLAIFRKIRQFPRIDDFLQCHEGIHTGNAREVLFKRQKQNDSCKPLFYGGGAGDKIENWVSQRDGWFVDYRKELIDKRRGLYASLRDEDIFKRPKIYISRTGNPFKAFLDESSYASNNFFSLQFKNYDENDTKSLKVILPFILAPITQYFIRKFAAPRLGDTFVETKIIHLLRFRIPPLSPATQNNITRLVDRILAAKARDAAADVSGLEREIDQLVYRLYGLTPEEINIVEGKST